MKKSALSFAAVAAMVVGLLPNAFATWTYSNKTLTDGDWTLNCTLSGTSITIGSVKTAGSDAKTLDFTDVADGYSVTAIGGNSLKNVKIAKVVLPDTVTSIGVNAFYGATGLTDVRLSANLATIGGSAFDSCTALKTVSPLLPTSLTSVGGNAFKNCPLLEGDVELGSSDTSKATSVGTVFTNSKLLKSVTFNESCFVSSGVVPAVGGTAGGLTGVEDVVIRGNATEIAASAFVKWTGLKTVTMPETITKIGNNAFQNCTSLETVTPFLPEGLAYCGMYAFDGCGALAGELNLSTGSGLSDVSFPQNANGYNAFLQNCKSLTRVTIGKAVGTLGGYLFAGDTGITEVEFYCGPSWANSVFNSWVNYQARFVVPADDAAWQAFFADSNSLIPPEKYTAAQQTALADYIAKYGDDPLPIGLAYTKPTDHTRASLQWVVARKTDFGDKHPLQVRGILADGTEVAFGTSEPAYGDYEDVTVPLACTVEEYAADGLTLYRATKSVLEAYDSETSTWVDPVETTGRSFTHDPDEAGVKYRLSWVWEPAGYKADVVVPAGVCTVTETSTPDLNGYYSVGTTATFEARGTDSFERWGGDIPAGHGTDNPISVVMDGVKKIVPYCSMPWTSVSSGKYSDGYWTLTVSGGSVTKAEALVPAPILDLAKAVPDTTVTTIGASICKGSTTLVEVRLPETVEKINDSAFQDCTSLETVTPFLPANLSYFGIYAFSGCTKLTGDLYIATNEAITSVSFPQNANGYNAFFMNCKALTRVTLGKSIDVALGGYLFNGDTSISEVEFYCGPNWAGSTFEGWTDYQARFVVPADDAGWQAFFASTTYMLPPEKYTAADTAALATYVETYGDDPLPLGLGYTKPTDHLRTKKEWVVARKIDFGDKHPLQVRGILADGTEVAFGTSEPAYGDYEDVTVPLACTVEEYAAAGQTLYRATKSVLETYDSETSTWVDPVETTGRSFTHNPDEAGVKYRLSWVWEPAGYKADVVVPAGVCTVTETSTPDLLGYYTPGTAMGFTVTPAGGDFVRWYGDVPSAQVSNTSVTVTSGGEAKLYPYVRTDWTVSAGGDEMTDGYWTLKVELTGADLKVKGMKVASSQELGFPALDFAKTIRRGSERFSLTKIASQAFYRRNYTALLLEELMLPETLTTIGDQAFTYNHHLATVTPFLPDSVTAIGESAFESGEWVVTYLPSNAVLRVGFGGPTTIGKTAFRRLAVKEVHFGPNVSSVAEYSFQYALKGTKYYWYGDKPDGIDYNTFGAHDAMRLLWFVPRENATWDDYFTFSTPTAKELETFAQDFPGVGKPRKAVGYGMRGNAVALRFWKPGAGFVIIVK